MIRRNLLVADDGAVPRRDLGGGTAGGRGLSPLAHHLLGSVCKRAGGPKPAGGELLELDRARDRRWLVQVVGV